MCAIRMQTGREVITLPGELQLDAFAVGRYTSGKIIEVEVVVGASLGFLYFIVAPRKLLGATASASARRQ